jgi:lipoic acid synthetase
MKRLKVIQPAGNAAVYRVPAGQMAAEAAPDAHLWPRRKPGWLRVRAPGGDRYRHLKQLMRDLGLNSVCEEAHCPNIGECWESGTATFLIMGDKCTRNCPYCAIAHGRPEELDEDEPRRVAEMIRELRLRHVVITSVDRDDLPDGGAQIFASVIEEIRLRIPDCSIEVLTPDFQGDPEAIATVMAARPEIFNHNMETVRRLHRTARPGGRYERSLGVLRRARELDPGVLIKTGIMLGLGESEDDVRQFLHDALGAGVQILTLGQYLRPSERHIAIDRYVSQEEFAGWKRYGEEIGFPREQVEELQASAGAA